MKEKLARPVARLGMNVLMRSPARGGALKDWLMVFHYCRESRQYHHDRLLDFFSKNEHYFCSGCGKRKSTGRPLGYTFFTLLESFRLRSEHRVGWLRFWWNPDKYLPADRGGRSAGELEATALEYLLSRLSKGTQ